MADDITDLVAPSAPAAPIAPPVIDPHDYLSSAFGGGYQITSAFRTPEHNAAVGGVPNSDHLTGHGFDIVVPGMSTAQVRQKLIASGAPNRVVLDEGSHVHWSVPANYRVLGFGDSSSAGNSTLAGGSGSDDITDLVAPSKPATQGQDISDLVAPTSKAPQVTAAQMRAFVATPPQTTAPQVTPQQMRNFVATPPDHDSGLSTSDLVTGAAPKRSLLQRFEDNFSDAFERSVPSASTRAMMADDAYRHGPINDIMGHTGEPAPWTGGPEQAAMISAYGHKLVADEAARRQQYAATSAADPFYSAPGGVPGKVAAGASTLAGVVGGSMTDPINWFGAGKNVLTRALSMGGAQAFDNVLGQQADVRSGVQSSYSPTETATAAITGGLLPIAGHFVARGLDHIGNSLAESLSYLRGHPQGDAAPRDLNLGDDIGDLVRAKPTPPVEVDINKSNPHAAYLNDAGRAYVAKNGWGQMPPLTPDYYTFPDDAAPSSNAPAGQPAPKFPDAQHAALYDLGADLAAGKGPNDPAVMAKSGALAKTLGPYMDWSDDMEGTGNRARRQVVQNGPTQYMIQRAAQEYYGQTHDLGYGPSFVDPDKAGSYLEAGGHAAAPTASGSQPVSAMPKAPLAPQAAQTIIDKYVGLHRQAAALDDAATAQGLGSAPMQQRQAIEGNLRQLESAYGSLTGRSLLDDATAALETQTKASTAPSAPASPTKATGAAPGGSGAGLEPGEGAPFAPSKPASPAAPASVSPLDLTDQAIDYLRKGKTVDVGQGPSLSQFVARNGKIANEGGELSAIDADYGRVGTNRITSKTGLSADAMAQRAHEAGYFPDVPPPAMDGSGNMAAVTGPQLINAIKAEQNGRVRFAGAPDPAKVELQQHVNDLEELLHHLGVDPRTASNAEIKSAISSYFAAPEPSSAHVGEPTSLTRVGDLHTLPREELQRLRDEAAMSDHQKLVKALGGEAAAKDFERLQRTMNNTMDPGRADKASAEFDSKYANLTPEQERLVYGIGDPELSAEQIDPVLRAHDDVVSGDGAEWASYMAATAARHTSVADFKAVLEGRGTPEAQGWFVRMQRAYAEMRAAGVRENEIPQRMAQALVDRAGWKPEQAHEIISGFVKDMTAGARRAEPRTKALAAIAHDRPGVSPKVEERLRAKLGESERVRLADGEHEQRLIPGVEKTSQVARDLEILRKAKDARRGASPMPAGSLFDETAKAQQDLFGQKGKLAARASVNALADLPRPDGREPVNMLAGASASDEKAPGNALASGGDNPNVLAKYTAARPEDRADAMNNALGGGPPRNMLAAGIDLSGYGDAIERAAPRPARGLRDAPTPGAVPDSGKAAKVTPVRDLVQRLKAALDVTHRQGRLGPGKGKLGEYDPLSGVVRTKAMQELDVAAHEYGHALEFMNLPSLKAALLKHAAELTKLAYPGAAKDVLREEGFAEFFRWYMTDPALAQKRAPGFFPDFEAALAKDRPALARELKAIQGDYQTYLKSASTEVVKSMIVDQTRKGPISKTIDDVRRMGVKGVVQYWANNLMRDTVDDLHPLNLAVRRLLSLHGDNIGQRLELRAAQNPYALARMSRGAYASAHMDVMHGVVPYKGTKPEGPGLSDALETAFGKKWSEEENQAFGAYLAARRLVHEWKRYSDGETNVPPAKVGPEAIKQAVADFERLNPTWSKAADQVYEWTRNLFRKERDAGFVTNEQFGESSRAHPDYVPLQRDLSDLDRATTKPVKGSGKYAGGLDEFVGSVRDILNPIQTLMQRAYTLSALKARNDVVGSLVDLAEKAGPGAGTIIEKIPDHEARASQIDIVDALEKAAKQAGVSPEDTDLLTKSIEAALEGKTQVSVHRMGDINERGEPIIYHWKGGKRAAYRLPDGEFGKGMFDALAGMNKQSAGLVVSLMAKGTQALRTGVTLHPEFFFANYVRDQMANWILSDVGFKPFVDGAGGIAEELKQGEWARLYNSAGGISGGANVASLDKARIEREIGSLNKRGYQVRRFASLRGLIHASEISETGTRLGLFRQAFKQAKKDGLNDYDAAIEAAFTARDVLDWDRHGAKMLSAARTVTFLNASLQGLDKSRRVLTADGNLLKVWAKDQNGLPLTAMEKRQLGHAAKAWAKVSALGVLGLTLRALYANDPEYEEIPQYLRGTHWMIKAGGHWLAVPKPFELAALSDIMERGYEGIVKKDPTAWGHLLQDMGDVVVPPHEIPALAVPFQIAANRDNQGQSIVPDYLRYSVNPEMQFNSYTSRFGRTLGKAIGVSPAVIDYAITGFGGSWGRTALATSQLASRPSDIEGLGLSDTFIARRFVRDATRGSVSTGQFYDLVAKNGGQWTRDVGTVQQLIKQGQGAQAQAYIQKLQGPERGYVMASVFGHSAAMRANPIGRADGALRAISDVRRNLSSDSLKGPGGQPIVIAPSQRRDVDRSLAYLAMTTARNSLIDAGVTGWAQKERLPQRDAEDAVYAANPAVGAALRMEMAKGKVLPPAAAYSAWQALRGRFESDQSLSYLPGLIAAKEAKAVAR